MTIERKTGHAPRVAAVARDLTEIGGCIGCDNCRGLCAAVIEAMALPDAILHRGA